MDILNYALAKKIFGKGTSGGGGESGVPLKVTKLPEASSKSVGKVYFVDQKATPKVGDVLGNKLYFDTTKNPMDYLVNAGGDGNQVPILVADIDSEPAFQLMALIQPVGDGYLCMLAGLNADYSGAFLYINSNVLTVEEYNQEAATAGMPVVTEFGWQVDEMDISPVAGATVSYVGDAAEVIQIDGGSTYYLGTEEKSSFAVGSPLGNKILFDTTKNPANFGVPAGKMAPVLIAQNNDYAQFQVIVGEALGGGEQGICYMVMCGDLASQGDMSNLIYVQCDVLTVDQFNEMMGSQMGFTIAEFGWQTDVYNSSAYADYVVQENYLPMLGNFAYGGTEYSFEKANEVSFKTKINTLENENNVLQEQYNEVHSVATVLQNSATELYIPDDTPLEEGVLAGCNNIVKMSLPSVSNTIGTIFGTTPSSLKTVDIRGGDIVDYAFLKVTSLTDLTLRDGVTKIFVGAFRECTGLTNIDIPDSVTTIGDSAFYGCTGLRRVDIGNGVTHIRGSAFRDCTGLTDLIIGDGVTYIDKDSHFGAFKNCTSLTNLTIGKPVEIIGQAFSGCEALANVTITNGATSIGQGAFAYAKALTSVDIPDSVTSIGDSAFFNCESLTSVDIPDSVTSIGNHAFFGCAFTSIDIPNSVTSIGDSAFRFCENIINMEIPDSVISIGSGLCYGCKNLTSVTLGNSLETIGAEAFYNLPSLASITLGNSLETIGDKAFAYCSGLTSLTFGNNLKTIGADAFFQCSGLTSVDIPDSVTSIGNRAFHNCDGLTSVTLGNSLKTIGAEAFYGIPGITSINIPDNVTSIGDGAFANCSGLTSVTLNNILETIGAEVFLQCLGITSINIPDSVTSIGDKAFRSCDDLTSVTLGNNLKTIGAEAFRNCRSLTSIDIPDSVTSIGAYAFNNCVNITSLTLGNSLETIGDSAFGFCSYITSIDIPDSVTSIGADAFRGCSNINDAYVNLETWLNVSLGNSFSVPVKTNGTLHVLDSSGNEITELIIPDGVTSISDYLFTDAKALTSVIIPASLTSIGEKVFMRCHNLTSVVIPDSLTSIGAEAFFDCDSLTSVTLGNSLETIGNYAFSYSGKLSNVTIKATIPPYLNPNAFEGCTALTEIYVPAESVEAYKAAEGWSAHADKIQPIVE